MWQGFTVMVDDKVYSWKGWQLSDLLGAPAEAHWHCLESRYWPSPLIAGKVKQVVTLTETCKAWEAWMCNIGMHPNCPVPETFRSMMEHRTGSGELIKSAEFTVVLMESLAGNSAYLWCKDNQQAIPWETKA